MISDVKQLAPGAALDVVVAEKVMGWHRWDPPQSILHHGLQWYWTDGEAQEDSQGITLPPERAKNNWHPSTSIADAWELWPKIGPRALLYQDEKGLWYIRRIRAIEFDMRADEKIYRCHEPLASDCMTTSHALCLAALKAVGVEVKDI